MKSEYWRERDEDAEDAGDESREGESGSAEGLGGWFRL
jgi:hypothetical protein